MYLSNNMNPFHACIYTDNSYTNMRFGSKNQFSLFGGLKIWTFLRANILTCVPIATKLMDFDFVIFKPKVFSVTRPQQVLSMFSSILFVCLPFFFILLNFQPLICYCYNYLWFSIGKYNKIKRLTNCNHVRIFIDET